MHRPLMVAAFVLLLALAPVSAQHGGGHASGGGHGGMASHGGFGGHSGGHAFSGAHSGSGLGAHSFSGSASRGSFSSRGFNHSGGGRLRSFGFRNNCRGYGCGYGYPYLGGGIDPYWWWNSGTYDQDQQDQTGLANEMNQQSLDEQRMREQGDHDAYARSVPPPPH